MKLHVLSENLQKNISLINRAISPRSQLPILLNILIKAINSKLQINATDLEIGIQTETSASVEEEGEVTVPAKIFLELVNSLPEEKISLSTKDDKLELISKTTKSVFQTSPFEEYPKLFEEKGEEIISFSPDQIKKEIGSVAFAASLDTTRPSLSGVLLKKDEIGYLLVATDGYRLSLRRNRQQKIIKNWGKHLLIPARVLREVMSTKQEGGDVKLLISEKNNQLIFSQENILLVGRLIEGDFPNYERIIPSDFETRVEFDREELQKAVKTCSIFARDSANIIKMSFKKDSIIVSANTPSVGQNIVKVEAITTGEENEIAFNARYLLELFANIEENDLIFEMTGPLNSGVFKIKNNPDFLHIIMPIRVQG